MALKSIIFFGLLAVALGFTLPGETQVTPEVLIPEYRQQLHEDVVLSRSARSPQGRINVDATNSRRGGTQADIKYTHPINDNLEAYAKASRNFKHNDNSGHVGLSYKF